MAMLRSATARVVDVATTDLSQVDGLNASWKASGNFRVDFGIAFPGIADEDEVTLGELLQELGDVAELVVLRGLEEIPA